MVKKEVYLFNIYMILWVLYNFHWNMTGRVQIIERVSSLLLALILFISFYYFCYANFKLKLPRFFYILDVLIGLFVVYGMLSVMFAGDIYIQASSTKINKGSYMVGALRSFLPIYAYYVWTIKGVLTERRAKIWGVILFLEFYYAFFNSYRSLAWGVGTYTSGTAYLFTSLLPFVFLFKKRKVLSIVTLAILLLMILWGMKRGAIVIALIFTVYFIWTNIKKESSITSKIGISILVTAFLILGVRYVTRFYENNSYLQVRVDQTMEGGSSGRDEIASNIWEHYTMESNIWQLLFGFGADGSLKIGVNYAHNDWLEMLADTGLFGFVVYLAFWLSLFNCWLKAKQKHQYDIELLGLIVIMLPRTMFSMFYSNLEASSSLILAFYLASSQFIRNKCAPSNN